LPEEFARILAHLLDVSRATLLRALRRHAAPPRLILGLILAEPRRPSRATFALQACDPTAQSGAIPASCHAP
jgi:hypothetical protein